MAGLGITTADLARMKQRWTEQLSHLAAVDVTPGPASAGGAARLASVEEFGSNPGRLRMRIHVPDALGRTPGLVVALHGCTQDADGFAAGSGWIDLADRYGFVLLCPEQTSANNPKNCFNWFQPSDTTRDRGELLSIREMIARATADHGIDPRRIFVTGCRRAARWRRPCSPATPSCSRAAASWPAFRTGRRPTSRARCA